MDVKELIKDTEDLTMQELAFYVHIINNLNDNEVAVIRYEDFMKRFDIGSKNTVAKVIKGLRDKGYVMTTRDAENRNVFMIRR